MIDYNQFEEEMEYIEKLNKEEIDPSEAPRIAGIQKQIAALQAKKTKMQSDMQDIDEEIAKLDAQMSQMKIS
jgi:predicted  nucleic acid-binding Zn-ribbon protein